MPNTSQSSIRLRQANLEDLPEIEDLAKEAGFPLPQKFVGARVTEKNDDVTAFGVLRGNIEAILYCSGTPREKVEALKLLVEEAKVSAKKLNYNYLDVIAKDEAFAQILIKHFGFRRAVGVPLILDL